MPKNSPSFRLVPALEGPHLASIRTLFQEYAFSMGFDLSYQDFDQELSALPGKYAPPGGRLLLLLHGDTPAGCIALRPLEASVCEMKRLYVRPAFRNQGAGQLLVEALKREAAAMGYRTMRLDTLKRLDAAERLYRSLGFLDIAPYIHNPMEDAVYLECPLNPPPSPGP